jgi:uncharacterized protein YbjT (DUF2867 family)
MGLIGVTGATGRVGGRVARLLSERGVEQRLLVRSAAKAPQLPGATVAESSFDAPAGLDGIETLLMVSAAEHPDRVGQHVGFLDAAAAAGVQRVVYTSFLNAAPDATFTLARDHWVTEQKVLSLGLPHVFLRDSLYADFLPLMRGEDGAIRGPAGSGRFAPVAIDDVAEAAVAALLDDAIAGRFDLTGPALQTMAEVAAVLSDHGLPTTFVDETEEEAYASRSSYGAPEFEVRGWVTSYLSIRDGSLATVSDGVQRLTGHAPRSLADLL